MTANMKPNLRSPVSPRLAAAAALLSTAVTLCYTAAAPRTPVAPVCPKLNLSPPPLILSGLAVVPEQPLQLASHTLANEPAAHVPAAQPATAPPVPDPPFLPLQQSPLQHSPLQAGHPLFHTAPLSVTSSAPAHILAPAAQPVTPATLDPAFSAPVPDPSPSSSPTAQSTGAAPDNAFTGAFEQLASGTRSVAPPFSVSIEGTRYYGGLITYTHHLHPARICRVLNACIRPDGTLSLPSWMQRYDDVLSFHCGQARLDFSLPDTEPPQALRRLDLIGLHATRPSMPDFLTDFIPNAVVFDLIYGDHNATKTCHSRRGADCAPFPGLVEGLRPAVVLHPRLRRFEERKSWARELVKLMKPVGVGRQTVTVYDDELHEGPRSACFRSAIFTRGPFNRNIVMADHLRSMSFLQQHGVVKKARTVGGSGTYGSGVGECELNVTLSNRKLVDGALNRLIGRYIMNVGELREAILLQAQRIPGLRLNVAMMTLEGRSLRWQVNAMQKTDVWVAGHGALLSNMLFLRENSTVVELQPFAFYPPTFEKMALRLAHVRYDRYIAHPDVPAFETCMRQLYPASRLGHAKAMGFLNRFRDSADKFFRSDSTHSLVLHNIDDADLHNVRTCALMQRLDTNPKNFAIAIVRQARLRCGLPAPELRASVG